jgi:hypothetical protein
MILDQMIQKLNLNAAGVGNSRRSLKRSAMEVTKK